MLRQFFFEKKMKLPFFLFFFLDDRVRKKNRNGLKTCKAASCGLLRLERTSSLNAAILCLCTNFAKISRANLKKNDWHGLVFIRADLWGKNIKFKRSVCERRLVDFDLFLGRKKQSWKPSMTLRANDELQKWPSPSVFTVCTVLEWKYSYWWWIKEMFFFGFLHCLIWLTIKSPCP